MTPSEASKPIGVFNRGSPCPEDGHFVWDHTGPVIGKEAPSGASAGPRQFFELGLMLSFVCLTVI